MWCQTFDILINEHSIMPENPLLSTPYISSFTMVNLNTLISPIIVSDFFDTYWEKRPLRISRQTPNFYRDLLSLASIDKLISTSNLQYPGLRLVKDGVPLPKDTYSSDMPWGNDTFIGVVNPDAVYRHFRNGATIILQALHKSWRPLSRNLSI